MNTITQSNLGASIEGYQKSLGTSSCTLKTLVMADAGALKTTQADQHFQARGPYRCGYFRISRTMGAFKPQPTLVYNSGESIDRFGDMTARS